MSCSSELERRVHRLFAPSTARLALDLLERISPEVLPLVKTERGAERVRFAVLKLSEGNLDKMKAAIAQALIDWRDVLMAAGFGEDVHAHESWSP